MARSAVVSDDGVYRSQRALARVQHQGVSAIVAADTVIPWPTETGVCGLVQFWMELESGRRRITLGYTLPGRIRGTG